MADHGFDRGEHPGLVSPPQTALKSSFVFPCSKPGDIQSPINKPMMHKRVSITSSIDLDSDQGIKDELYDDLDCDDDDVVGRD